MVTSGLIGMLVNLPTSRLSSFSVLRAPQIVTIADEM